jgi:hypothetical protein
MYLTARAIDDIVYFTDDNRVFPESNHMDCTALMVVEQPALPAELTATLELAADFAKASKAKATQDAPPAGIEGAAGHG